MQDSFKIEHPLVTLWKPIYKAMTKIKEVWKAVPNYEGIYEVSNTALIKSLPKSWSLQDGRTFHRKEKILSLWDHPTGYHFVTLIKNGVRCFKGVHQLVASAFIPNPLNKPHINHKDFNGLNNSIDNLEWCTAGENIIHAVRGGRITYHRGENHSRSKSTDKAVKEIKALHRTGQHTNRQIGNMFGLTKDNIWQIVSGKTWKHI